MKLLRQGLRAALRPATSALALVLLAVYGLEIAVSRARGLGFRESVVDIKPSVLELLGGNVPSLTRGAHETFRLLAAALLHGGLLHLVMNLMALIVIGPPVETAFGAGWLLAAFTLSALAGNVVSAVGHGTDVVAIGASGGIFGLIAMAAAWTFLSPERPIFDRARLVQWLVLGLVVGLGGGIDNWGHLGGLVGGALVAFVVSALRTRPKALRGVGAACGVASVFAFALVAARAEVAYAHPAVAYDDHYNADLDTLVAALKADDVATASRVGADIGDRHPDDQQSQYFAGRADELAGHCELAIARFRKALVPPGSTTSSASQRFVEKQETSIHHRLVLCLEKEERADELAVEKKVFCALLEGSERERSELSGIHERLCLGYDDGYETAIGALGAAQDRPDDGASSKLAEDAALKWPDDPQAQYFAGKLEAHLGRCAEALPMLRAAALPPGPRASSAGRRFAAGLGPYVHLALTECLEKLGQLDGARLENAAFCRSIDDEGVKRPVWMATERIRCADAGAP